MTLTTTDITVPPTPRDVPDTVVRTPIQDLCTVVPVGSNTVEVGVLTGSTGGAAVVTEGQPKPEATYINVVTPVTLDLIADWAQVTRQVAQDAPALTAKIAQGRAVIAKAEAEAAAAIVAGAYSVGGTNADMVKAAAEAIGTLADLGLQANAVLVGAADLANFVDVQTLFGVPVVPCPGLTGKALVGDFKAGVEVYRRDGVASHLSESHDSTFTSNVLTLLQEARQKTVVIDASAIVETAAA